MGIPRLRMPAAAPSRSTLKLYEAWLTLLSEDERQAWLCGGMRAVDLGAAPGGWTWQLVQKGMLVTAVDNGRMDAQLMASGMVEHVRADGFAFRPRKAVDWMVCDMVEKPLRIAELTAAWFAEKRTQRAIVNFKLPMKKRFEAWMQICDTLEARAHAAGVRLEIRAKQLYHDREELTALVVRRG
jgi:23S rRNA (cytidine2498-2'-O)-methyltransferase